MSPFDASLAPSLRYLSAFALLAALLAIAGCGDVEDPSESFNWDGGIPADAFFDIGADVLGGVDAARDAGGDPGAGDASVLDAASPDAGDGGGADVDSGDEDSGPAACASDAACDDQNACTVDACEEGVCRNTAAPVEDDGNACTVDACDPATGSTHEAIEGCCAGPEQCPSGVCQANQCRPASCEDGAINGTESDVDCGGDLCGPCAPTQACFVDEDCSSSICHEGFCVECVAASDCEVSLSLCQQTTCEAFECGVTTQAPGSAVAMQTAGDCQQLQCDAQGDVVTVGDSDDVPGTAGRECVVGICEGGQAGYLPLTAGMPCQEDSGTVCDGMGFCVQCLGAEDCPGEDTACAQRTCVEGICGAQYAAQGTPLGQQTPGDCREVQCDGAGNTVVRADDEDAPMDDGLACAETVCLAGVAFPVPSQAGTVCAEAGGQVCDGSGTCVACVTAADCPGEDSVCAARTCVDNVCGVAFAPANSPVPMQTPGDCRVALCDGMGGLVDATDDTDRPDDGNGCTVDICMDGTAEHPPRDAGAPCGPQDQGLCDGQGRCLDCQVDADCPAAANACQRSVCQEGSCAVQLVEVGTPVGPQQTGDCMAVACDGAGQIAALRDDDDVPNDGLACTQDVCQAGAPVHLALQAGTACAEDGGTLCNGQGACVQCLTATQCPGVDGACVARTCTNGACGVDLVPEGSPAAVQESGDCLRTICDGQGGELAEMDGSDVPADNNSCTDDVCQAGGPAHIPSPEGQACEDGLCDGQGNCVACLLATDCPQSTNGCGVALCAQQLCGMEHVSQGELATMQQPGDCMASVCDGSGGAVLLQDDADVPVDGFDCTRDVCEAGMPVNILEPEGTPCGANATGACNSTGFCVPAPFVVATTPEDGTSALVTDQIQVHFSEPMDPATLVAQPVAGPCQGSVQVSLDGFASCIGMTPNPLMSLDGTKANFAAIPGLLVNRQYAVRVTREAKTPQGLALATAYTSIVGFGTASPDVCEGSVVIAQVYSAGGNANALYNADYVVLHNRGMSPVTLTNWSIQYASATGSSWLVRPLNAQMSAGGYLLVQMTAAGTNGDPLPAPDVQVSPNVDMAATAGKVALVKSTTTLSGTCPTSANIVDFVGFGATANCFEGTGPAPAPSATTAVLRRQEACADGQDNAMDLLAGSPAPRNSQSFTESCGCRVVNENASADEADYCNVQFPMSIELAVGGQGPVVYGRLFEAEVTPADGAPEGVLAQLGYGPAWTNPQWQAGWVWSQATFNTQVGNDDEFQASFLSPQLPGDYRYTYRFSLNRGVTWTYCSLAGAGSNAGLVFRVEDLPPMQVLQP